MRSRDAPAQGAPDLMHGFDCAVLPRHAERFRLPLIRSDAVKAALSRIREHAGAFDPTPLVHPSQTGEPSAWLDAPLPSWWFGLSELMRHPFASDHGTDRGQVKPPNRAEVLSRTMSRSWGGEARRAPAALGQAGPMEDEADAISIDDILVLREMSERLGEALALAESRDAAQLVELLRRTKAWVDRTLARNPSSERN